MCYCTLLEMSYCTILARDTILDNVIINYEAKHMLLYAIISRCVVEQY